MSERTVILITNRRADGYRAVLQAAKDRAVLKSFKPRYAADRVLERIERHLTTHDERREELHEEYCVTDEEGRRLCVDDRGRVLYPAGRPNPMAPMQFEVETQTPEGTRRQPFGGRPAGVYIDPEREAEFDEKYEEVAEGEIEIELHLVPEREFEKEGAVDWEALDGDPERGIPRIPFRAIRQLLIRGNQDVFEQPSKEERGAEEEEKPEAVEA